MAVQEVQVDTKAAPLAVKVAVSAVSKVYGPQGSAVFALDRISLQLRPREFVCLVGASGCGKTTLLNLIAGLDSPDKGTIEVDGRSALLFQESALFPWLTARHNIELALRLRGIRSRQRRLRAAELIEMVNLAGFADSRPHELSGGMRQRVALGRALAQEAEILLMDEPFGALDAITRDLMHDEVERLWKETATSVIFVTHNVREAVRLGDRVLLLSSRPGSVVAEFPVEIDRPRRIESPEVAGMAGEIVEQLREEVRRHSRDRSQIV